MARCVLTGFHFRAPGKLRNWISEITPRGDVLEIRPECRRSRRDGCRDAEGETARETENLGAWGGESGRGPARVEGDPGCRGGVGRRNFRFSVFQRADVQISKLGVSCRSNRDAGW